MIRTALALFWLGSAGFAEPIVVQSTTSTQNSGLYDAILPKFTATTGIDVRVVAVGTGQALKNARNCDGDLLIVHAKGAEEAFVTDGFGETRADLMHNDFVIVGPAHDYAAINGMTDVKEAMHFLNLRKLPFVSRGDDSGTHQAEKALWDMSVDLPPRANGNWYFETGAGMGATLNTAVGLDAYTITDRATWVRFANKRDFVIHVQGDPALFNQYGVVTLNAAHCPNANHADAAVLRDWLLSDAGQSEIAAYQIDGEQVFFPNPAP